MPRLGSACSGRSCGSEPDCVRLAAPSDAASLPTRWLTGPFRRLTMISNRNSEVSCAYEIVVDPCPKPHVRSCVCASWPQERPGRNAAMNQTQTLTQQMDLELQLDPLYYFVRVPGLFRRWEFEQVLSGDHEYRI